MDRLESDLKAIESQHHIDPRWQPTSTEYLDVLKAISVSQRQLTKGKLLGVARERIFYLNTLRHHAGYILRIVHVMDTILLYVVFTLGGQKQAQKISKMIAMCTSKAKTLLAEYKSHCSSCGESTVEETTVQDVFNMNSPFWNLDHTYVLQRIDCIPVTEQRRLIEIADVLARCSEELQYCISDILNMYTFFTKCLINLNLKMYSIVSSTSCESAADDHDIDPSEYQMYLTVGKIIDSTDTLPQHDVEVLSAGIAQAEYVFYQLQRIDDVAKSLVMAYWTISEQERESYIRKALLYSELPISVPHINILLVHDNNMMQDELNEDQDQFEHDSYITSDEQTSSSTDTETDE